MPSSDRKRREFETRERLFLDNARRLLVEEGYDGLMMDRVAEMSEYSKGVVYKHFGSKEDLIAALAIDSLQIRLARFEFALQIEGTPREKLLAIEVGEELFLHDYPYHMGSELIIKMAGLQKKIAPERLDLMESTEQQCFDCAKKTVTAAIKSKDLKLKSPLTADDIVIAVMSLKWGFFNILQNYPSITATPGTFLPHIHAILDGYNWKPLTTDFDYQKARKRIIAAFANFTPESTNS